MNNLLSINIPTFNRSVFLKKNLERLIPICTKYRIPIYISDNKSTDDTLSVIDNCMKSYDLLFVSKLETNMGIDYNMDNVVSMSNTKYSWLFSDDDEIDSDAIEIILNMLERHSPDFLLLNCRETALSTGVVLNENFYQIDNFYQKISNKTLLKDYAHILTLLSACVINNDLWKKIKIKEYSYKYYFHLFNIFSSIDDKAVILLIKKPLFTRFRGNKWNFDNSELDFILHFFYPLTIEQLKNDYTFSDKLYGIGHKLPRMKIGTFLRLREAELVSYYNFPKSYIYLMGWHLPLALISLIIPSDICGKIYKKLFKIFRNSEN